MKSKTTMDKFGTQIVFGSPSLESPRPVGRWHISDDFFIDLYTKPHWWFRMWTTLLLGWKWEDA